MNTNGRGRDRCRTRSCPRAPWPWASLRVDLRPGDLLPRRSPGNEDPVHPPWLRVPQAESVPGGELVVRIREVQMKRRRRPHARDRAANGEDRGSQDEGCRGNRGSLVYGDLVAEMVFR